MLVQKSVGSLFLGVSSQEPSNRIDGQVEESINMLHTVEKGVSRRNPTEIVSSINIQENDTFIHSYERGDGNEAYIISVGSTGIQVFDSTGVEHTVNYEGTVLDYLNTTAMPSKSFKALTVGDTTFLLNTEKSTAMGSVRTYEENEHKKHPFYWVKRTFDNGSNQGYEYECKFNGMIATATGTKSTSIASSIVSQLNQIEPLNSFTRHGSIAIGNVDNVTNFSGSDSYGGQASLACWGITQDIKDLPTTLTGAEDTRNVIVEISGDPNNNYTNYWVIFKDGHWKETVKPYMINNIDQTTMPIKIISEADGSFTVRYIEWDMREVGDEFSAPEPSFIGKSLKDIFFFKNRLCFIAGENVVMSETGSYYNFFPTTVTDVLDSDPIDVAVDSNRVALLNHAVPFDNKVILTSTNGQFSLQADRVLSPTDVSIASTTSYNALKEVSPISLGDAMYFLSESTKGIALREFFVQEGSDTDTAIDLSGHASSYVPNSIITMTGNTNQNILFILSEQTKDTIYVYKFYNDGTERIQTAWSKWVFGGQLQNITILGNYLYLLIDRGNGVQLERLDYSNKQALDYRDLGSIEYESSLTLSELVLRDAEGNIIQNARSPMMYKTLQLASTDESRYKVGITNNLRLGNVVTPRYREVANYGVIDNKFTVRGKNIDTIIKIINKDKEPLEFHTYTIEANYNGRAKVL